MANELIICHPIGPKAVVTSTFGEDRDSSGLGLHVGIDWGIEGTPIYSVENSTVINIVPPDREFPNIFIKGNDGKPIKINGAYKVDEDLKKRGRAQTSLITLQGKFTGNKYTYKHLDITSNILDIYTKNNNSLKGTNIDVRAGEQIGIIANFGFSTGPHLHFEMPGSISPPTNAKTVTKNGTKFTDPESWLKENVNFYSKENTFVQPVKNTGSVAKANSNAGKRFTLGEGDFTSLVNIDFVKLVNKV